MANNSDENREELGVTEVDNLNSVMSQIDIATCSFYANPEKIQSLDDLTFATGNNNASTTSTSSGDSGSGYVITEFVGEGAKTFDLSSPANVVTIPFVEYDQAKKEKKIAEAKASVERHEKEQSEMSREE